MTKNFKFPISNFQFQILLLVLLVPVILLIPSPAYAHILATDKTIGAIMHINPADEAIAKQQTSLFFEFKDKTNTFSLQNCDCTFLVLENDKQLYSQPITDIDKNNLSISYTFPNIDLYTVKIVGKSLNKNSFQPFTLSWDIRVDKQATEQNEVPTSSDTYVKYIPLFTTISIGVIIFVSIWIFRKRSKTAA